MSLEKKGRSKDDVRRSNINDALESIELKPFDILIFDHTHSDQTVPIKSKSIA